MNKTESVSIGRRGFVCEQDAYAILQKYLERSAHALKDDPDKDEILADLELSMAGHIAELSKELVVDKSTALKVIDLMGEVAQVLGPDLCREAVVPEIVKLAADPMFRVRKATAQNFGGMYCSISPIPVMTTK